MTRVRMVLGVVAIGAVVWLVWPSAEVPLPWPDVQARERDDRDAKREARKRRALQELRERYSEPTRTVSVKVIDCRREPAVHAEVSVLAGGERVAGIADELGVFRAPVPEDAVDVSASATRGAHYGMGAGKGDLEVVICPGATVEGVVRDDAGRPVRDAVVRFGSGEDVAVTEDDGEFVLSDQFVTAQRVSVEHASGFADMALSPALQAGETRQVELVVEAGRRVVGQVFGADGLVAANVDVRVSDGSGDITRATSDRDGRFWLTKVPFEAVRVRADAGQRGGAEVTLAPGQTELVLRLFADRGTLVVTWEGTRAGTIRVLGDFGDQRVASGHETLIAAPSLVRAVVDTDEGEVACGEGLLLGGERLEMRCGAMREAKVIGRLLGADGRPQAGAGWTAKAVVGDRMQILEGRTDAAGRFEVRLAESAAARVSLDLGLGDERLDPLERRNIATTPGRTTDLGDLQLRDRAYVSAMFEEQRATGAFGGLGGQLASDDVGVRFSRIVRDGPLAQAGVRAGDVIMDIDGRDASQLTEREALLRLRGKAGTGVALRLFRPGEGQLEIELERAIIDMRNGPGWVD